MRGKDQEDEQQKNKTKLLCRFAAFVNDHRLSLSTITYFAFVHAK